MRKAGRATRSRRTCQRYPLPWPKHAIPLRIHLTVFEVLYSVEDMFPTEGPSGQGKAIKSHASTAKRLQTNTPTQVRSICQHSDWLFSPLRGLAIGTFPDALALESAASGQASGFEPSALEGYIAISTKQTAE